MKAWELIEREENWCKGTMGISGVAPFCAIGALCKAYDGEEFFAAARKLLRAIDCATIPRWNDAPERTHAQVLAAMKKADV